MFQQSQTLSVHIDACPTYEFLLSLCTWNDVPGQSTYEVGQHWFQAIREQATPDLLNAIEDFCQQNDWVWAHLLSVAYDDPALHDIPTFIDHLAIMDALEVRLRLLGYYLPYFRRATPQEVIRAAANGDPEAQQQFLRTSYPENDTWQALLRRLLPLDPVETRGRLVAILRRWYGEVFHSQESELLPILLRDAEARRSLATSMPVERLIETVTNGWEYIAESGIRHVLLIPSVVIRPQVHSLDHHDVKIFCYPVADEYMMVDPEAPPARLMRLVKALGDERRLRILKRLATGRYTLQQLADHFEVGKTLIHHHLVVLRGAGLVQLRGGDNRKYGLRRDAIADLTPLLESYLTDKSL
jgi:DNA-binding transcriptional ArsR family regulator